MAIDLNGLPICITGASAGIGRATAIACAQAGMRVVVAARRAERLDEVVETIRAAGGQAVAAACDVTDQSQCEAMVTHCVEAFGSIYAVLANAGYGYESPMHAVSDEAIRAIFETNFFGTMNTIRPALPMMLEAGCGHVLITSSSIGVLPIPGHGHYCATKAAQHHVGRAMGWELRKRGVRVSTIHPIGTRTEFFEQTKRRSQQGQGDAAKPSNTPTLLMQDASTVARAIVRCLRRPRSEVWPGGSWWVRVLMAGAIAAPASVDLAMRAWR